MTERKKTGKKFIIPGLLAAGFGNHDPAQAAFTEVTSGGGDVPDKGTLLRVFTQDHLVTLAQHRSHSSHSSHSSHRSGSGGGGHYSHMSHTSHRSSTGGYDPYPAPAPAPPSPVYTPPSPPPPPPAPGAPRATAPSAAAPGGAGALPALSGRSERFAAIVRRVQIALLAQGFFNGPITGTVGPVTRAALRAFQQARGLPGTGTITPETLDALRVSSE